MKRALTLTLVLALAAALPVAAADAPKGITDAEAFAKIKAMAGSWSANVNKKDGPASPFEYGVTGGGSAVTERMFAGQPHEMMNVYYMDGDNLRLTHYCDAGNQPRMRFNAKASSVDRLVFDFDGITGLKSPDAEHIDHATIRLVGADAVESEWFSKAGEKDAMHAMFFLKRAAK